MAFDFNYKPDGATLRAFMRDDSFVRGLRGPIGSGKSVACAVELFRRALAQAPDADGVRRTRWAVIRNTNPQLKTTTIKTWLEWFPEDVFGKFNWAPPFTHRIKVADVDMEVIFLSMDRPEDVRKLLSLELTGAWVNEAREIARVIIAAIVSRVDRYPSMKDGGEGATWAGMIMDTNAPAADHWWPMMSGEAPIPEDMPMEDRLMLVRPDNWRFFTQPPAMHDKRDGQGALTGYEINPERENARYIKEQYYRNLIGGQKRAWIENMVQNKLGAIFEGGPVYPAFSRELHVARERLVPLEGLPIHIGLDFGLTPAATFGQRLRGRWLIFRELVEVSMGAKRFGERLREIMAMWPGFEFVITGDPAGDQRAQTDETTPFEILRATGIVARPASTNDWLIRHGAVEQTLTRLVEGRPGLLVDPGCHVLIAGFDGGYHIPQGKDRPDKTGQGAKYSHPHDALQYMMLGGGEGRALMGQAPGQILKRPMQASTRFNPMQTSAFRPRGF